MTGATSPSPTTEFGAMPGERTWTDEQRRAIERRTGDLLLDASAGSGKTSVLVERFVRSVLQDGVDVGAILTITFTEKAAAELRDRIRSRLRELGADEAARRTEGAFISTIHGFCARVLRAHALAAGLDPRFEVLDGDRSGPLAAAAFDDALEDAASGSGAMATSPAQVATSPERVIDLIAAYGVPALRAAILSAYAQLRSAGQVAPRLPVAPCPERGMAPPEDGAASALRAAAAALAAELGAIADPSPRVVTAMERVERCLHLAASEDVWPADLGRVVLPRNGAALSTDACAAYAEALQAFRAACAARAAGPVRDLLDALLAGYGTHYEARKAGVSGLDFEDLELLTRRLLDTDDELRARYAERFAAIMVDELQDTNRVQLELIESIARDNLFTVGDAQQSIYGFRHADVELFRARGRRLEAVGGRETLRTNFRTRPEIIDVLNPAFADATTCPERGMGADFTPLRAGRDPAAPPPAGVSAAEPLVELIVADKGADWNLEGIASPWRQAEAAALADRVAELVAAGASAGEIVVLMRATTDMRAYERALERRGLPTYVIGGRGYWDHPQVVDIVGYLRALANPRDEEALYGVLASPLVGVSLDALVVLASAARAESRDPWRVLRGADPDGLPGLQGGDRERLTRFTDWFERERGRGARAGLEELIDGALTATGYDLAMLAMPGGTRRLANVRKLMRLGREHEAAHGPDLRRFLALVDDREAGRSPENREGEAPVEGEGLDAIRLMTIHRAKGLEFPIVCVADLGRSPRPPSAILRLAGEHPSGGRLGLRLARAGVGGRESAFDYRAIGDELRAAEEREERRLFYVAMTRAQERLILSGAAKFDAWRAGELGRAGGGPIQWIAPALVPELTAVLGASVSPVEVARGSGRLRLTLAQPAETGEAVGSEQEVVDVEQEVVDVEQDLVDVEQEVVDAEEPARASVPIVSGTAPAPPAPPAPPAAVVAAGPPVGKLSYSALAEYARCAYRFYAERVLSLPQVDDAEPRRASAAPAGPRGAADTGVLVHALLERLDFRRPVVPSAEIVRGAATRTGLVPPPGPEELDELAALVRRFSTTELCARLGRATEVRREQRFAFGLDDDPAHPLVVGALDVLAREQGPGGARPGGGSRSLVVDYKTDRLDGATPEAVVARAYGGQRLVYALAALHAGADEVQVAHCFLQAPELPVIATFTRADTAALRAELATLAAGVLERQFPVAPDPRRGLCRGCPAQGGLCSWPVAMTRRESADTLF